MSWGNFRGGRKLSLKHSIRSKRTNSELDYSKILIIRKSEYIGSTDAIVDKDEFNETRDKYIDNYVDGLLGKATKFDKKKFKRVYEYSTLQYFH